MQKVDYGYCPWCWSEGLQAECKGSRCLGWDALGSRCYLATIGIALWRLSTKLPGDISDAAYQIKAAVTALVSRAKE